MRVSSTMMTANYMKNLNRSSQRQAALMEQGDGSSLHRASDNPIQYSRTLRYNNSYAENKQYTQNVKDGISFMKTSESAMTSIADIIKSIKEKAEGAANGTNTESDVAAVGKEVQSMIEEIVTISNTQLGNRYVFSGQRDNVQPYEIGTERLDKADVKTLDDTQKSVFSHYEHDSDGNIVNNSSGNPIQQSVQQMLTMKDSSGNSYYVDPTNGNIFTKDYVDSGYKETLEQNEGLSGDELYQKVAANAVGKFDTTANVSLTATSGSTTTDDKTGISVQNTGSGVIASDASTGMTINTGTWTITQTLKDSDGNSFLITATTGGTTVTDADGNAVTSPLANGTTFSTTGGVFTMTDGSNSNVTKLTTDAAAGSATLTVADSSGAQLSSTTMTTTADGVSVDYKAGFNNLFTKNDGTSQKAIFTVSGQVVDSDNSFSVSINGTATDLSFSTSLQTVAYYFGDNNKISMTNTNGADTPRSDSVNVTGSELFGTDLFGNSGTSVLDDLYSVYDHLVAGDSSWISSDGLTLIDNAHETVVSANTSMGSRNSTYQDMQTMFDSKGTVITSDITDASGTDVAALAVALTTASTVYNMSLALGSKLLPQSLADYL